MTRPVALAFALLLTGCTDQEVQWYGFWGFCALLLVWGAIDLWHRRK